MELVKLLVSLLLCFSKEQGSSYSLHPPDHGRNIDKAYNDRHPGEKLHSLYGPLMAQTRRQRGLLPGSAMQDSQISQTDDKTQLAQKMKQRFLQFRRNLEEVRVKTTEDRTTTTKMPQVLEQVPFYNTPNPTEVNTKLPQSTTLPKPSVLPVRIRPEPLPLRATQDHTPATKITKTDNFRTASPQSFDPSIVVNFFKLAEIASKSEREQKAVSTHQRRNSSGSTQLTRNRPKVKTKIVRRKLQETPLRSLLTHKESSARPISNQNHINQKKEMPKTVHSKPVQTNGQEIESFSLYISRDMNDSTTAVKTGSNTEYGSYSQGNDPEAGIPASEVVVPDLDLSQLHLPQDVRDSLQNYLQPLLSLLQPLRQSVPGLPGLDYPILNVVPYTNFYCSKMPWPGYYADTEARCQTWHACDVDGRQSTFLCPNGTVFNQALMVCDWWYNTDCLSAPFLYSLNERLFGVMKPQPVVPYNRITLDLLDTIFL